MLEDASYLCNHACGMQPEEGICHQFRAPPRNPPIPEEHGRFRGTRIRLLRGRKGQQLTIVITPKYPAFFCKSDGWMVMQYWRRWRMPQSASISRRCGNGSTTGIKRGILRRILAQVEPKTKGWTNFACIGARWFGVAASQVDGQWEASCLVRQRSDFCEL